MRVHVNDPDLVEDLLDFLRHRVACVAARVSEDEVDVSLLESFRLEAHQLELERMLRAWETARPTGRATIRRESRSDLDLGRRPPRPS